MLPISYFCSVNYGFKLLILNVIAFVLVNAVVYNLLHIFHIISLI
jgi:hypothetical protein